MADLDLDTLSFDELKAWQKAVAKAIDGYEARRKAEALAAADAAAREFGFSLADLTGGAVVKSRGKSLAVAKYRHPDNAALTWTGRGRQPVWFKDAIAAGKAPADLAV